MTKAIFFDIDGTLVSFQTHRVSSGVLDGLRRLQEKGIRLFIATGRHRSAIGAAANVFPFDGFITLNGQYCYTRDKVLRSNPFSPWAADHLIDLLEERKLPCVVLEAEESYTVNRDPRADLFPNELDIPLPPDLPLSQMRGREIYQAVTFLTREEELAIGDPFPGLEALRWHPKFADVIAPGGGKDHGMDAMLAHFGIDLADTMAFGDGENDLTMLHHAQIGVAMGNGNDKVRTQADYVTGTVDEDGILTALEHFGVL